MSERSYHGAMSRSWNSTMGPLHEGSIRRPIAPWANALTTELHLAPGTRNSSMGSSWRIDPTTHRTMSKRSYHRPTSRSLLIWSCCERFSLCLSLSLWVTNDWDSLCESLALRSHLQGFNGHLTNILQITGPAMTSFWPSFQHKWSSS